MDRVEEIIEEKDELEERIDELRREYSSIAPPCGSKSCMWFNSTKHTHCILGIWVTECKDYKPDEEIQEQKRQIR